LVTKSEGFLFNCYVKYVIMVNLAVIQALKHVKQEKECMTKKQHAD